MKAIEASYARQLADSTLNAKSEKALLAKHRATYQALQNTITQNICQGGNRGILLKEKFINRLDSIHLRKLPLTP